MPPKRQMMLFSATFPNNVAQFVQDVMPEVKTQILKSADENKNEIDFFLQKTT